LSRGLSRFSGYRGLSAMIHGCPILEGTMNWQGMKPQSVIHECNKI
jgi:hypothetical protein